MGTRGTRPQRIKRESAEPQLIVDVNGVINYGKERGFINDYYTNIEGLIKSKNIKIKYSDELSSLEGGKLKCINGEWEIIINKFIPNNQQRFILAHEFGYYSLYKTLNHIERTYFRDESYTPIEEVVINFALNLLMPEDNVKRFVLTNKSLNNFSKDFNVTRDHGRIRLKQLGFKFKPKEE